MFKLRTNSRPKKKDKKKKATHVTMMVIPHNHGVAVKNYCLPMWLVKSFMVVSVSCILIVTYFISGFFFLKYLATENKELKEVNMVQAQEISELQGMAGSMKNKLEALMELDQQVRAKIGLTKAVSNEKDISGIDSSRSEKCYEFITMGLGGSGEPISLVQNEAMVPYMPYIDKDAISIAPGLEETQSNQMDMILELPVADGEVDTLEVLKEQLSKVDEMLTQQAEAMDKLNSDVDRQIAYEKALPNAWPVQGRITSGFGWRRDPYNSKLREYHEGIDIAAAYGTPVRAAGDGVVTFSGYKSGWGKVVIISHGFGFVSMYAHNSKLLVEYGDKVTRGEIISRLGNTGRSTGPHVHFGVARNGKWIDPLSIINH